MIASSANEAEPVLFAGRARRRLAVAYLLSVLAVAKGED
jgi:hypothetical protein